MSANDVLPLVLILVGCTTIVKNVVSVIDMWSNWKRKD